jgi:hypothetical protein
VNANPFSVRTALEFVTRPRIGGRSEDIRPGTVFHYTGASAFDHIIRNGIFRATNFRYLDDPTEVQYGIDVVLERLEALRRRTVARLSKEFWKETAACVSTKTQLSEFYMCSFTRLEDDVGMWRAFGTGPARYALGFDSEPFAAIATRAGGWFTSIIYDRSRQESRLSDFVKDVAAILRRGSIKQSEVGEFAQLTSRHLGRFIMRFKSAKYQSEEESRIIIERPATNCEGISFDVSRGYLRPYISIPLALRNERIPLQTVWVLAPGRLDIAHRAAELAIQAAELPPIPVHKSTVPLVF